MDHLPIVQRPSRDRKYPEVPLLCDHLAYGTKSRGLELFCAFPEVLGYRLNELERAEYDAIQLEDTLPVLQAWLFFGILAEVFEGIGVPFNAEEFVEIHDDGVTKKINTTCLPKYLYCWMAASVHSSREVHEKHAPIVDFCLLHHGRIVNSFCNTYTRMSGRSFDWAESSSAVLLSLAVLGDTLSCGKRNIRKYDRSELESPRWSFPLLEQALLEVGWCPGDIATKLKNRSPSYLLYLSTIDRRVLEQQHTECTPYTSCRANQVDFKMYKTRHSLTCDGTSCEFVGPSMQDVGAILEDGDIPLIAMDTSTEPSTLHLVRYQKETVFNNQYVAISHVWSDGLGNPHDNRLPICQLEQLHSLVNETYTPKLFIIPFWIDTISVPLQKKWKMIAIARMDRTYAEADSVLVLNSSLQLVPGDTSETELLDGSVANARILLTSGDDLETVAQILNSQGDEAVLSHPNLLQLARAVTFEDPSARRWLEHYARLSEQDDSDEEGLRKLAIQRLEQKECYEQGRRIWRDKLVDEGLEGRTDAVSDLRGNLCSISFDVIWEEARSSVGNAIGLRDGGIERIKTGADRPSYRAALQFAEVCIGYNARTTSRLEDEAICLGVLLGLDVMRLVQIPVLHWRLKEILLFIRSHINLGPFTDMIASVIDKTLNASREKRMKAILSQVDFFSEEVIFWDFPRLQGLGWQWAPASFMDNDPNMGLHLGGQRCRRTDYGLMISSSIRTNVAAIRLRHISFRSSRQSYKTSSNADQSSQVISLDFQGRLEPPNCPPSNLPSLWKYCRLRTRHASSKTRRLWQELPYRHDLERMVILVKISLFSRPEANFGVLASEYKEEAGITYLRYEALIQKAECIQDDSASHVGARWLSKGCTYCLG
ncbi:MAG: hypothetical protein Q9160_004068 [Pyrenula sp. 1 TL-2023]